MVRMVILWACCVLSAPASAADGANWPAWRGDGSGVSSDSDLPVEWGPTQGVVWKTRIEGDGISSPIVWQDKVFVTTAVKGSQAVLSRTTVVGLCGGLLVVAVVSMAFRGRRSGDAPAVSERTPGVMRTAISLDKAVMIVTTVLFVVGVAIWLTVPERLIQAGDVARAWRVSGVLGMLGFAAAAGRLSPGSRWRLVVASLCVASAIVFHKAAPLDLFNRPITFTKLMVTSGPLTLAAVWYLLLFLVSRGYHRTGPSTTAVNTRLIGAFALLLTVALIVSVVNYLQPRTGLLRSVVCIDRDTGSILWQKAGFLAPGARKHRSNSYATPTPVTDGKYIVAHYGPGMACFDLDGTVRWTRMEPNYTKYLRYGASSSPIMFDDLVIYAFYPEDGEVYSEHAYLAGFDKESGEVRWKVTPPHAHDSYGTPLLVYHNEIPHLYLTNWEVVVAYDPTNGMQLWSREVPIQQAVPSIVSDGETLFAVGGTHGPKAAVAIQQGRNGNTTETHIKWSLTRGIPECASPVVYGGLLYWINEKGIASCVDAETGEVVWKKRIRGHYITSLVAGDGKIYFTAESGETTVVQAGREFKQLARNSIGEECLSSPAVCGDRIYIRGKEHLFCIGVNDAHRASRPSAPTSDSGRS